MRKGVVIIFLILILGLSLNTPANLSSSDVAPAIGHESTFITSADGDESSESILQFESTLGEDVLFYPDSFFNDTPETADSGVVYTGSTVSGDYTDTKIWAGEWSVESDGSNEVNMSVTVPVPDNIDGFELATYVNTNISIDGGVRLKSTNGSWYKVASMGWDLGLLWGNYSNYDAAFWNATHIEIGFHADELVPWEASATYVQVQFYYMTLADADHYAESFADVSEINATLGETVTTDNDLGTFHHPGDNDWDYYYWNDPSALAVQVIEWRIHANISSSSYEFALYSADDGGGSQLWTSGSITAPTSAATKKYSPMVTAVESIRLATRHASNPAAFIFDYLRAGKSTESGWAHDGSTTAGIDDSGTANVDFTVTTDGDKVTLNATAVAGFSGSMYPSFYIRIDSTTTRADIERDYYPFLEINITACSSVSSVIGFDAWVDGYRGNLKTIIAAGLYRFNIAAMSDSKPPEGIIFFGAFNAVGDSFQVTYDWVKIFSIANFTVTQSGAGTDDYLYTSSGVLHSNIDTGYIEANHDPALSVASASYSVWNLTTGSTAPQFSDYISSWATYSSETRGPLQSGTVTDIKLKFSTDGDIAAITFIEDATAPIVVRSSANPTIPADDEAVTLSAVIEDTLEVYKVYFDAIVYPAGFSDSAYYATEQSDNLWTYDFSTLDAGYYCFKIQATDGANTNSLTEYAYVELTVREAAIIIQEITLIGAGQDFTMMTFSARINRDSSYTIYEESVSSSEAATYTGSVTSPSFNLAWEKLPVDDLNVNFTITFVSGALTENYTSQYQIAQVVFDVVLSDKTVTFDWVCLEGESTKAAAYAVYDINNVLRSSGTIPEGSFALSFEIWNKKSLTETFYGVKFTNGSSTDWINGTYYADDPEEYKGGGVVTAPLWWADPMTWVIIGGFAALMFIATSGQKVGNLPNAPKGLK